MPLWACPGSRAWLGSCTLSCRVSWASLSSPRHSTAMVSVYVRLTLFVEFCSHVRGVAQCVSVTALRLVFYPYVFSGNSVRGIEVFKRLLAEYPSLGLFNSAAHGTRTPRSSAVVAAPAGAVAAAHGMAPPEVPGDDASAGAVTRAGGDASVVADKGDRMPREAPGRARDDAPVAVRDGRAAEGGDGRVGGGGGGGSGNGGGGGGAGGTSALLHENAGVDGDDSGDVDDAAAVGGVVVEGGRGSSSSTLVASSAAAGRPGRGRQNVKRAIAAPVIGVKQKPSKRGAGTGAGSHVRSKIDGTDAIRGIGPGSEPAQSRSLPSTEPVAVVAVAPVAAAAAVLTEPPALRVAPGGRTAPAAGPGALGPDRGERVKGWNRVQDTLHFRSHVIRALAAFRRVAMRYRAIAAADSIGDEAASIAACCRGVSVDKVCHQDLNCLRDKWPGGSCVCTAADCAVPQGPRHLGVSEREPSHR
jgi:hypothetical protein